MDHRDRMARDLAIRGLSPVTQKTYLTLVERFLRYVGRPADDLTLRDVTCYQDYLVRERKVSYCIFNQSVRAIRFFVKITLGREWDVAQFSRDSAHPTRDSRPTKRALLPAEAATRLNVSQTALRSQIVAPIESP